jgi:replication fork protection complex subunit Tof1/Swi1
MLEKYSKNKSFMYIRKKKARRARKKAATMHGAASSMADEVEDEEEADVDRGSVEYAEHVFRFADFESVRGSLCPRRRPCFRFPLTGRLLFQTTKHFAEEGIIKTFMAYLAGYKNFRTDDQVKWIVNLMHRQAVKAKAEALFFKVRACAHQFIGPAPLSAVLFLPGLS